LLSFECYSNVMNFRNLLYGSLRLTIDYLSLIFPIVGLNTVKGVCLIRLDALGDFISWVSTAEIICLHNKENNLHTILIANDSWSEFAQDLNIFDKVISVNRIKYVDNLIYRFKKNCEIRHLSFLSVINPVYGRELYLSDSLIRITIALKKIGFACLERDSRHKKISDKWYTQLLKKDESVKHNILTSYLLLDFLGIHYKSKKLGSTTLENLVKEGKNILNNENYYVIAPGAGWGGRSWPVEKWEFLTDLISEKSLIKCVIIGSEKETILGRKIAGKKNNFYDLTGKTTIQDLARIISMAKFVISNETSGIHFAMQLGIPSICILGGGHYEKFLPLPVCIEAINPPVIVNIMMPCYGCNWSCIFQTDGLKTVKCIADIEVFEVWNAININNFFEEKNYKDSFRELI
jgi:ADP-heptose:LPS heptosyltransferase